MTPTPLAPELTSLAFLVGSWRGSGRGDYPTIDNFEYDEEVVFGHVGKPFLSYAQRTWNPDGAPLHTEAGYIRPVGVDRAELVIAQPTGVTEIHSGLIAGTQIEFVTDQVGASQTAKEVRTVTRALEVVGDTLTYRLEMAAVGHPLQFHLEASLRRV